MIERRAFLAGACSAACGMVAWRRASGAAAGASPVRDTVWHGVETWGVNGRAWGDTARFYDRLPARAEGLVPDRVWELSRQSAGMHAEFETDAAEIHVRYELLSDRIAMPHMPATGVSGVDLYGLDGDRWRWASVFRPTAVRCEGGLISGLDGESRRWRLYLPLYNGVNRVELGVPDGAAFEPVAPDPAPPVVFYGTSILHGACASRPGMAWPSILGRRLGRPTVNLGFSGNGRMEEALARLLGEIHAAAYVVDCAPNMHGDMIRERAPVFVRALRGLRPETPIVLVEDRVYGYSWARESADRRNAENRRALRDVHAGLVEEGVGGLSYVRAESLLGDGDGDLMTDGSHPNDLGMSRYADALEPVLRGLLR